MSPSNALAVSSKNLRYGLRQLRRTPGFALAAVLTLALGIGANSAVFSVMNAVLLRYLPVENPERLVMLRYTEQPEHTSQTGHDETSLPENVFEAMRAESRVFSDLMAFVPLGIPKVAVRIGNEPEEAAADEVSGNFFSGLGVPMARGRGFTLEDEKNHTQVAILSYDYWTRRFGRAPSVLGQTMFLKGVPFTVVGVAGADFAGLERDKATDLWVPFQINPHLKPWGHSEQDKQTFYGYPSWFFLMMIGRTEPGVSAESARAQLNPVYKQTVYAAIGQPTAGERISELQLTRARGIEGVSHSYREPLMILMAMVALVLVIACANVAMLLVARNAGRQRELSVRMALGASRGMLFGQLLTESLFLVTAGGFLGWGFALLGTRALARWSNLEVSLSPDWRVLLFALGLCALAVLVFGLAPLRSASNVPVGLALKTAATASSDDRSKMRAGQTVVALQISLCLMLLVGAGLLVRTLKNLENANLGLRAQGLLVFGLSTPEAVHTDPEAVFFFQTLVSRLRTLPSVESATLMGNRLGGGWSNNTGVFVDGVVPNGKKFAPLRWNPVGPDFLHVLGIPLELGRDVTEADTADAPRVAVINQTFATEYIKDRNPIGHRITLSGQTKDPPYTVIGVAADNKYTSVRENQRPMAYIPYTQVAGIGGMQIEMRTGRKPSALLSEVRRLVGESGPDLPLLEPMTQEEQFAESFSDERLFARLSIFFGVLAGVLVATGLYGNLAYRVSRRTGEIGVRMALGAQRHQVLLMVFGESLLVCAAGVMVGVPAAIACSRLLRSMLFNLSPGDPLAFVVAIAGIALVTLAATAVPARRASSVDPIVALRYE